MMNRKRETHSRVRQTVSLVTTLLMMAAAAIVTYGRLLGHDFASGKSTVPFTIGSSWGNVLTPKSVATLAVVLMAAVVPLVLKGKTYRSVQLWLNVAVSGLWSGTFLSYSFIAGTLANGINLSVSLVTVVMLIVAFAYPLFGKKSHYCMWMCPLGSAQELMGRIGTKHRWRLSPQTTYALEMMRDIVWAVLMLLLWLGIGSVWMDYELFVAFMFGVAPMAVLVAASVFLALSVFISRPYCRFLCPTGNMLRLAQYDNTHNNKRESHPDGLPPHRGGGMGRGSGSFSILLTLFAVNAIAPTALAQHTCSLSTDIRTVRLLTNGEWGAPPVILKGSGHVDISFDDMQASSERYHYTITHCNADWTESDLTESEYMTGFNDTRIEEYEPAIGTEMDYCHYAFTLPNDDNSLLVSGNYRVNILDDDDTPVAQACFSILEPHVGVDIEVTANTDIDSYNTHQQVAFSINYSGYQISNPSAELIPVVLQNRRWDTHVGNLKPSFMQVNRLVYDHQRSLIFAAGNEFRRFEILNEYIPTMRVDRMKYESGYYHAYLFADERRINYLFDRDQNGRYLIRNDENENNDTESDYFFTHFTLSMPQVAQGDVYLFGDLTGNRIDEAYKMEYSPIDHCYQLVVPLKQGSYNYMYMTAASPTSPAVTAPTEGDFHQTENEYWVYIYQRPFGERYDHLVGFKTN